MSKQVIFSLLNRASNGNELLAVLDSFSAELESQSSQEAAPTLEEIQF
jgi:hypothetical protein